MESERMQSVELVICSVTVTLYSLQRSRGNNPIWEVNITNRKTSCDWLTQCSLRFQSVCLTLSFHGLLELSLQDLVLIFTEVLIDLLRFVMILYWLQEKLLNKIPVN